MTPDLPFGIAPGPTPRQATAREFMAVVFRRRLVILGPPASGKGTQGVRLARTLGVPHVSTGHLLRRSMDRGDPHRVRDLVSSGRLVRDEPGGLYAGDETTREFAARMRGVAADPEFDWTAAPVR